MAQLETGGDQGNSKQKKMNARVDFTPMVDMIMLLVTFFMLCTTLLKPQTMEIAMPSDKEDLKDEDKSQVKASEAITVIIDENNTIYYFEGKPGEDVALTPTQYGSEGIRKVLLTKNARAMAQVEALKKEYSTKEVNEKTKAEYKEKLSEIRNGKKIGADGKAIPTPTVVIKPSDKASYKNLIDVLDEMQICNIGKYVIDNFTDDDQALVDAAKGGAQ
ncbi:MAG: biopolymer transporter ExbD [Bacteroidaceae bacterium]|jgi:biopolymer transport protein ExbD|nr:biopolymer transporter ExbD [Bacteroidaceae bacterium]